MLMISIVVMVVISRRCLGCCDKGLLIIIEVEVSTYNFNQIKPLNLQPYQNILEGARRYFVSWGRFSLPLWPCHI